MLSMFVCSHLPVHTSTSVEIPQGFPRHWSPHQIRQSKTCSNLLYSRSFFLPPKTLAFPFYQSNSISYLQGFSITVANLHLIIIIIIFCLIATAFTTCFIIIIFFILFLFFLRSFNPFRFRSRYYALPFIQFAKIECVQIIKCNFTIFDFHHAPIQV
uniref:Uncharacterized protein n=1 Tax=Opuntia streptacantha TaxID=393608 RepID=A0A7C9ATQ1_OPUST